MFKIKKSYRLLLSTLLFVGVLLLQFHHHDHEDTIENCPICIIQEVFDIADAPQPLFCLACIAFIFIPFATQTATLPLQISYTKRSRAPPLFS